MGQGTREEVICYSLDFVVVFQFSLPDGYKDHRDMDHGAVLELEILLTSSHVSFGGRF